MACICGGPGFYRVSRAREIGHEIVKKACDCEAGAAWEFGFGRPPAPPDPPKPRPRYLARARGRCFADPKAPIATALKTEDARQEQG